MSIKKEEKAKYLGKLLTFGEGCYLDLFQRDSQLCLALHPSLYPNVSPQATFGGTPVSSFAIHTWQWSLYAVASIFSVLSILATISGPLFFERLILRCL
jgi:hypothetical protein